MPVVAAYVHFRTGLFSSTGVMNFADCISKNVQKSFLWRSDCVHNRWTSGITFTVLHKSINTLEISDFAMLQRQISFHVIGCYRKLKVVQRSVSQFIYPSFMLLSWQGHGGLVFAKVTNLSQDNRTTETEDKQPCTDN